MCMYGTQNLQLGDYGADNTVQYMNAVTNVGEHKFMRTSNEFY